MKTALSIAVFLLNACLAIAQHDSQNLLALADSMVANQLSCGGWPKNQDWLKGADADVMAKCRQTGIGATIDNGALAGSVSDLMRCLYVAVVDMGIPLASAVKAATINPARALGIQEQYGSLNIGCKANAVLLDKQTLGVKQVILRGKAL